MNGPIRILCEIAMELCEQARAEPQRECCGLLAGRDGAIRRLFPAANVASNPGTKYEIAAEELFRLMRDIRGAGLEMLGIYHSHPNGAEEPSPTDVATAGYPDVAYFIVSHISDANPQVRAFSIRDGHISEMNLLAV